MEVTLSEDQALIRDSIRELLEKEVVFDRVLELEREGGMDRALWGQLASLGWLGLPFPGEWGGGDGSLVDAGIVVEELARHAAMVPYAEGMIAGTTLLRHARDEVARAEAERVIAGGILVPAVLDEGDSYEAVRDGAAADGSLTGRRLFVDYGQYADRVLVAVHGERGAELRLASLDGSVTAEPLLTTARVPTAELAFHGTPISAAAGPEGHAFLVELGRAVAAVQALGYASRAFDMTLDYVRNRVQFGRPIGSFQAVQHHSANMAIMVDSLRFLCYEALWNIDRGNVDREQIAIAKAWASRAAVEVTAQAHQLHGGIGITLEYDLHFFSRRAKERATAWGSQAEMLGFIAGKVDAPKDWSA